MRHLVFCLTASVAALAMPVRAEPPKLVRQGSASQLVVQGKPMLVIGGELGNSSASSAAYMAAHWPRLRAMNLNTVLAPVAWEAIEPVEGRYDWTGVDQMIRAARASDLKLVILWFGAYKNSMSTYVPDWVKRDAARFPRAQRQGGQGVEILSVHSPAMLASDSAALAALMAHIRTIDEAHHTVVMTQVENEIGMLPTARDHGPLAQAAWNEGVPAELTRYLVQHRATLVPEMKAMWEERGARTSGSWTEVFGRGDAAEEVFTAWHYARFADALTRAAKAKYAMPTYVNVALNRPGRAPGEYPSGGPLPHLIDIWKAGAPAVDFLAPDIYFPNFTQIVDRYTRPDNPLFVPEGNNADRFDVPANAFYAIGEKHGIGFGPFSIESIKGEEEATLTGAYGVLRQMAPYILAAQGSERMAGFKPRILYDETLVYEPQVRTIGGYRFTIAFADLTNPKATPDTGKAGGLIVQIGPEEYLIAGRGITVTTKPVGAGPAQAGIASAYEGVFDAAGTWRAGRLLNGDQTHQGRHIRIGETWGIQRVKFYRYD